MNSPLLRTLARFGTAAVLCTFAALVTVQYARIVQRNITYVHDVHQVERDVVALQHKRDQQLREISRLSDPLGVIPEIHDRLHLVGDHEAIIYLKRHDGGAGS